MYCSLSPSQEPLMRDSPSRKRWTHREMVAELNSVARSRLALVGALTFGIRVPWVVRLMAGVSSIISNIVAPQDHRVVLNTRIWEARRWHWAKRGPGVCTRGTRTPSRWGPPPTWWFEGTRSAAGMPSAGGNRVKHTCRSKGGRRHRLGRRLGGSGNRLGRELGGSRSRWNRPLKRRQSGKPA